MCSRTEQNRERLEGGESVRELNKREEGRMNENVWENWTKEGKVRRLRVCWNSKS